MNELDKHFSDKIEELNSKNLLRTIRNYDESLLNFSSNDYLGLINNIEIKQASSQALQLFGAGAGASRLLTGNSDLYNNLEAAIAKIYSKESACVFSSGYTANIGAISSIVGSRDLIIADKLSHSCIIEGAKLSGAKLIRYNHNDYSHLKKILEKERGDYKNCLIISEAVFSMDGDRVDVTKLNQVAKANEAWTYIDYAHDIIPDDDKPDIVMGTFSKAFASLGGYVCASEPIIDYIKSKAKSLIYSTALPPSVLAASSKAVEIYNADKGLAFSAIENAKHFAVLLNITQPESQIVPIIFGDEDSVLKAQKKLEEQGFVVSAIRSPTVPAGTSRLRFSFSASHTQEQIESLAKAVIKLLDER